MFRILTLTLFLSIVACHPNCYADQEIKPTEQFSGTNKLNPLRSMAPKNGVILDNAAFQNLWAAWQPTKPLPSVDFKNHFVIVEIVDGPNNVFTNKMILSNSGDLKYAVASTRMAGEGFGYVMLIIPKTGIKSVNGKPITEKPLIPKPLLPPVTEPAIPIGKPQSKEGIRVEVVGKVQTGLMAIGGETTGTVVASNGIVWELDFQKDPNKLAVAEVLSGRSLARVTGTLRRVRGVEVPDRMVVKVDTISLADNNQAQNNQALKAKNVGGGIVPGDIKMDRQTRELGSIEPKAPAKSSLQDNLPNQLPTLPALTSFRSIIVKTTGPNMSPQTQTISPNGATDYGAKRKNEAWTIGPSTLQNLHRFIDQTDWERVPRVNRGQGQGAGFQFEVLIETSKASLRFFIDDAALGVQPELTGLLKMVIPSDENRK